MNPIPMILTCPVCSARHIDEGEFATKTHHTHSCQSCGMTWRPAVVDTVGVQFLPGFKNDPVVAFTGRAAHEIARHRSGAPIHSLEHAPAPVEEPPVILNCMTGLCWHKRPRCHAHRDGDCFWPQCPQNIPGNYKSHCPLDLLYPAEDED